MEAVSLESLPPEDSDLYIPNLSGVQVQNAALPSSEAALHSMQLSTIRYTPSGPTAAPAGVPPPIVAAQAPGPLIQGIYRTTFTTQVIAAQTFHYPPTPPIDHERGEKSHLQATGMEMPPISQPVMDNELSASAGLDKPVNPFPSPLPTPPDMESLHQHSRGTPVQQNCDDLQASVAKMTSSNSTAQQWAAHQTANICFMPQSATSCGTPYSGTAPVSGTRRGGPPGPVPALQQMCYSAAVSNPLGFNDPRYTVGSSNTALVGEVLKKMPALVKDGKFPCSLQCE